MIKTKNPARIKSMVRLKAIKLFKLNKIKDLESIGLSLRIK